jgi:hypothetical protein
MSSVIMAYCAALVCVGVYVGILGAKVRRIAAKYKDRLGVG